MRFLTMYDAIYPENLPAGGDAYLGYVGGSWPTFTGWTDSSGHVYAPLAQQPVAHGKLLLSMAVAASYQAEALDVERYDAIPPQAPGWTKRAMARGVYRPVLYSSQSNLGTLMSYLTGAGIARAAVRLLSAHYGQGEHICSPLACGAALTVDGTQWNSTPGYDVSMLALDFFAAPLPAVVVPQPPNLKENRMLPILVACSDHTHSQGVLAVHGDLVELVRTVADEQAWRAAGAPLVALSPAGFDDYVSRLVPR